MCVWGGGGGGGGGGLEGAGSSNNNKSLLKQLTPWIGLLKKTPNLNLNSLLVKRQIDNLSPGAVTGGN